MKSNLQDAARRFRARVLLMPLCTTCMLVWSADMPVLGTDFSVIPLVDGERSDTVNTFGGPFGAGNVRHVRFQTQTVHRGARAACIELNRVPPGQRHFFQCFASGFGPTKAYYQTRNLTRYQRLEFVVRNETGIPAAALVELKDHRDCESHRALYRFTMPDRAEWTRVVVPLRLDALGWVVEGEPDMARVTAIGLLMDSADPPRNGRLYLDDMVLVERDGPLEIETAPLETLLERLARRQWDALWSARSRDHGLIPNTSYQSTDAGLNATATVLWMLPAAVRRGWVAKDEADSYMRLLVQTLDGLLDRASYLPPRNVDWVTLEPSLLPEESSVDAAFVALALHQYESLPETPEDLRRRIDRVRNRFNFAAFGRARGWCMAFRYAKGSRPARFIRAVYDGHTNENKVISLAAHLSRRHHVPIVEHWNSDVFRIRAQLVAATTPPAVHSLKAFRAPFTQALLNLFVDVRDRNTDLFPASDLATNPWRNFVDYQQGVMARLAELGRPCLVQPDAGDDGSLRNYQQFSLYEDFGQPDLFMPWSVSFALLADADGAEAALRFLLKYGLHGPLGLVDSAHWATGAPVPYAVTGRHDFWNTGLSTMALLERLDGPLRRSRYFADLPEIRAAMDAVFPPQPSSRPTMAQSAGMPESLAENVVP